MSRISSLSGSLTPTRPRERQESQPEQNVFEIGARPSYASRSGASLSGSVLATRPRTTSQGTFGRVESQQGIGGSVGEQQASFGDRGTQAHQQTLAEMNRDVTGGNALTTAIQSYNDALGTYRSGTGFSNTSATGFVPVPGDVAPVRAAGDILAYEANASNFSDASPEWSTFANHINQFGNPANWGLSSLYGYARQLGNQGVLPENRDFEVGTRSVDPIGYDGVAPYNFNGISGALPGAVSGPRQTTSNPGYSPWTNSPVNVGWSEANQRPFYMPDAPLPYGGYGDRFTTPVGDDFSVDASRDVGPSEYQYIPGVERLLQPGQRESFESRDAGEYVPIGGGNFTPAPQFNFGNMGEGYTPLRWQQQMAPDAATPFTEVASHAATAGTPASFATGTRYQSPSGRQIPYPAQITYRNNRSIFPTANLWWADYTTPGGSSGSVWGLGQGERFSPTQYQYQTSPAVPASPSIPGIYRSLP